MRNGYCHNTNIRGHNALLIGADPELGDVGAVDAVGGQQLHQPGAVAAGRLDEVALADAQRDGRVEQADAGDRAVDDQRALGRPLQRRDEALAAGQVAEGAAVAEFAGVEDPEPPFEADPQVAAVAAGDARLRAAVEGGDDRPTAAADLLQVAGHQPGEHLFGDAGQGADADAGVARGLTRRGVGKGLDRRREDDVGRGHRRRHRARRSAAAESRSEITASVARRPRPAPRSASERRGLRSPGCRRPARPRRVRSPCTAG